MEGRGYVRARADRNVCARRGAAGSIMPEERWGPERCQTKRTSRVRERKWERPGQSDERRPEEGWVGALPGGGNLSNWFSLTARTQSCLSTWQTDSVRFSPMY